MKKNTHTNTPPSYHNRILLSLFQQGHSLALICHAAFLFLFFKLYFQSIRRSNKHKILPTDWCFFFMLCFLVTLIPEVIPAAVYATSLCKQEQEEHLLPDSNKLISSRLLLYMFLTKMWERTPCGPNIMPEFWVATIKFEEFGSACNLNLLLFLMCDPKYSSLA